MDGRIPKSRRWLVAAIAISLAQATSGSANDFIRQPGLKPEGRPTSQSPIRQPSPVPSQPEVTQPQVSPVATVHSFNSITSESEPTAAQPVSVPTNGALRWQARGSSSSNSGPAFAAARRSEPAIDRTLINAGSQGFSNSMPASGTSTVRQAADELLLSDSAGAPAPAYQTLVPPPTSSQTQSRRSSIPARAVVHETGAQHSNSELNFPTPTYPTANQFAPNRTSQSMPVWNGEMRGESIASEETIEQANERKFRKARNEMVSAKLIAEYDQLNTPNSAERLAPLESAPGWNAVEEQLKARLSACETLMARRAYLSAIEESTLGVLYLLRVLDLKQNSFESEPAWNEAQQALKEADEFVIKQRTISEPDALKRMIQSHETRLLKGQDVSGISPMTAAQYYRAYAAQRLVDASQEHPWLSDLYYSIGKVYQAQADAGDPSAAALRERAVVYYRSAQTILPSNTTNGSQLGYALLQMDRPDDAYEQLLKVVQQPNCPAVAYQNLAEASARIGRQETQAWAINAAMAMNGSSPTPGGPGSTLVELNSRDFARISPRTVGPQTMAPQSVAGQMPVQQMPAHQMHDGQMPMNTAPMAVQAGQQNVVPAANGQAQPQPTKTAKFGFGWFK